MENSLGNKTAGDCGAVRAGFMLQARQGRHVVTILWAAAVLLPLLTAYAGSFGGEFIYDDFAVIHENPTIDKLWPPWGVLATADNSPVGARPLYNLSLAVNYAVHGLHRSGYHVVNWLLHAAAALALMGLVRRMLQAGVLGSGMAACAQHVAGAVALLWALHPLNTECVTYITQRTEAMMGLMYLLTLYCATRAIGGSASWKMLAVVCCAAGMACKEPMASAPVMVLLYDRLVTRRSLGQALRTGWGLYAGLVACVALLAVLICSVTRGDTIGMGLRITPWQYLLTQAGVILHYMGLSFWPHPLILDYQWDVATTPLQWAPQAACILLLLAAAVVLLRRNSVYGVLLAWFFLVLGPSSSFLPIVTEVAAEHRMYLPLAALVAIVVLGACQLGLRLAEGRSAGARRRLGVAAFVLLAIVGAAEGTRTFARNDDYRSAIALYQDNVARQAHNPRARVNLACHLEAHGRYAEAVEQWQEAIRLQPRRADSRELLAGALLELHRPQDALAACDEALSREPNRARALATKGQSLLQLGRNDEAAACFRQALQLDANEPHAKKGLAECSSTQPATGTGK